jgi:hypothetical protein
MCVGWSAELALGSNQRLHLEANRAVTDGGGLALFDLTRMIITEEECPAYCTEKFMNGECEPLCLIKGVFAASSVAAVQDFCFAVDIERAM